MQYRQFARLAGLALGGFAARAGDPALAQRAWQAFGGDAEASEFGSLRSIAAMYQAELALAHGRPSEAVDGLRHAQDGTELYLSHAVLARALAAASRPREAMREADWLAAHRGRAYGEWGIVGLLAPLNVATSDLALLDGAEYAREAGDPAEAQRRLKEFEARWPRPEWPPTVARRIAALERWLATTGRTAGVAA